MSEPVALVDSHCHLAEPDFDTDREAVLARAAAAGVTTLVCVGATGPVESNLPAVAMSRAARITAVQATRASVPPRLMRRTPSEARSFTVSSVALDIRKFTGFGATAFTTAAICSRVLMPGA